MSPLLAPPVGRTKKGGLSLKSGTAGNYSTGGAEARGGGYGEDT